MASGGAGPDPVVLAYTSLTRLRDGDPAPPGSTERRAHDLTALHLADIPALSGHLLRTTTAPAGVPVPAQSLVPQQPTAGDISAGETYRRQVCLLLVPTA
jgi:hypothetical protein